MKKQLFQKLLIILPVLLASEAIFAREEVHFGTIFVEELPLENDGESTQINVLTDSTKEQQTLEKLYKEDIGAENQRLKKMNVERAPTSSPASIDGVSKKVGVVRNRELPQRIIYFLELRSYPGSTEKSLYQEPNTASSKLFNLQPGEMIKIVDSPDQYLHKLRMDRNNQGLWKTVATREEDIQTAQVYYDWRDFDSITSHDIPVELDILVPYGRNTIPVFSRPGSWTWRDCGLSEDLCQDEIDIHTEAYLFDSTIVDTRLSQNVAADYRLFYKVGYQIKDKDGRIQHKVGWLPSERAKRKISQLPKSLLATRNPNSFGTFESDEERLERLKKYYVFDANMHSENRSLNRWLASTPGQTSEVFFQNIAIDGIAHFNTFTLRQDFLPEDFEQTGVAAGVGIFAPIFIDLEIQGTFLFTYPLSYTESNIFEKAYLFRGEQWLLYTTPLSISGTPFKFGFGGYYMTMFASQRQFGFNSLVGFQAKALFENPSFWLGMRYGPTGQDFSFRFENREIGADLGIRLNPARKYESWSIYGDFSDTAYQAPGSTNATKFQILSIGVRKQF